MTKYFLFIIFSLIYSCSEKTEKKDYLKCSENILLKLFDIKGTAKELSDEVDFNFRIKVEDD